MMENDMKLIAPFHSINKDMYNVKNIRQLTDRRIKYGSAKYRLCYSSLNSCAHTC